MKFLLSVFVFAGIISINVIFVNSIPAHAENIVYSNGVPRWLEYDCNDTVPSVWEKSNPDANRLKYFSYTDGQNCHAILSTFDLSDLSNIENTTSVSLHIDSRSMLLSDDSLSSQYDVQCSLFYFGEFVDGNVINHTPQNYNSFSCTGDSGKVQEITVPFTADQTSHLQSQIASGNYFFRLMIFPNFEGTALNSIATNNYQYAIGKYSQQLSITGDGFNCVVIEASNWCNFYNDPWGAIKQALGADYFGEWFYVLVFLPIPMSVFLITRNGAYAGFVCLPIMLTITTIEKVVFEIALSMILIAGGFGFYEIIRKRLHE